MARTVVNSLSGPVGAAPSASSLAATARVGTVNVVAPGRSDYSAAETVHGLSTVRVDTGFHRSNSTPRLEATPPSAPWWIRFYARLPTMQDAGHGIDECRWVCRVGTMGLVLHETANGNIGLRLQPDGLAQDPINPALDGTAVPIGQWLRVELSSDGTDTVCEAYAGHNTSGPRIATWSGTALSGDMELSAYRYRRGVLLQPGDNDANLNGTPIEDRQNQLLAWNPDALPQFGADGDFGNETTTWVQNFQEAHGFALVDGEIGPETGAAMDLAAAEANGDPLPPPTWLSHLAADDAKNPGPAVAPSETISFPTKGASNTSGHKASTRSLAVPLGTAPSLVGGRGGSAHGDSTATGHVLGTKAATDPVPGAMAIGGTVTGTKDALSTVVESPSVATTETGYKDATDAATVEVFLAGSVRQRVEPLPRLSARATPAGRVSATAIPGRISGSGTRR